MEDLQLARKIGIELRIKNYCKKNKISILNITPYINHLSLNERRSSVTDAHPSAQVHEITGKVLAKIIKIK